MNGGRPGLEVVEVSAGGGLRAFVEMPWGIYRDDPSWVPPLRSEVRKALLPERHPFHDHADVAYYLARLDGRVVGRVAAIVNRRFNEFHEASVGHFGFFECVEDGTVAEALLEAAGRFCAARGMTTLQGPFNFSTNDEICSPGVLLEGFRYPPTVMMGHTPPYYAGLLESCGFVKAKDLLSYWVEGDAPPERLLRGIARLKDRVGVTLRPLSLRNLRDDIRRIKGIYHSAWERNWGFVPMTDAEFDHMAESIRPVIDPRFCAIAEVDGVPVGFALQLPDLNQAFRHMNGRLLPFGWMTFLRRRRNIDVARVLTLGVVPGYRHRGLDSMLIVHLFAEALKAGFRAAECAWILEDNMPMRRGLERIGGQVRKVYRVFERPLGRQG